MLGFCDGSWGVALHKLVVTARRGAKQCAAVAARVVQRATTGMRSTRRGASVHLDRQCIGHDLARVVEVRQAVDDWDVGVLRELDDVGVCEQPRHHHVVHAREHAGDVLRRLALADADLLAEAHGVSAQAKEA